MAPKRSPSEHAHAMVPWTTRHFRTDLLRRLRIAAVKAETTLEDMQNRVIEAGLPVIEKATRE